MRLKNIMLMLRQAKGVDAPFSRAVSTDESTKALRTLASAAKMKRIGLMDGQEMAAEAEKAAAVVRAATEAEGVVWKTKTKLKEGRDLKKAIRIEGFVGEEVVSRGTTLDVNEALLHAVAATVRDESAVTQVQAELDRRDIKVDQRLFGVLRNRFVHAEALAEGQGMARLVEDLDKFPKTDKTLRA